MLGLGLGIPLSSFIAKEGLLLDMYSGAAAAYSLSLLSKSYTGDCISVRRSSDDFSASFGFVNGELDSTSLLTFVNEDVTTYTSDFSANADNWTHNGGTVTGNIDGIGGFNDVLRFAIDSSTGSHFAYKAILDLNQLHDVKIKVYIPSTNTQVDRINVSLGASGSAQTVTATDTWVTVDFEDTPTGNNRINVFAIDGGTTSYTGNGTDVIYIKDVVVVQKTANGHVDAWFDQANAGSFTYNTFTSFQPYIVKNGSYLGYIEPQLENIVALEDFSYSYKNSVDFTSFIVAKNTGSAVLGGTTNGAAFYGVAFSASGSGASANFSSLSYFVNGVSVNDIRQDVFSATTDFTVLATQATPIGTSAAAIGYVNQTYNNMQFKELVIYDNQTIDRAKAENSIMKRYGF